MRRKSRRSGKSFPWADLAFALAAVGVVAWGVRPLRVRARPPAPSAPPSAGNPAAPASAAPPSGEQVRRAREDMERLKEAMLAYREHKGELPPLGDYCAACWGYKDGKLVMDWALLTPDDPRVHMTALEEALLKSDGMPWFGPYLDGPIPLDPWGREYTYDDNDPAGANPGDSSLISAGPDRRYGTEDDIVSLVLGEAEGRKPLAEWIRSRAGP